MFDSAAFVRVVAFAAIYAGIEYRYINRYERGWTKKTVEFNEKPVFWVISPYQLYLLLPLFVVVAFSPSLTAWGGNTAFLIVLEDAIYFMWRRKPVGKSDWTTTLMGSFRIGRLQMPLWWPLGAFVAALLFWLPV